MGSRLSFIFSSHVQMGVVCFNNIDFKMGCFTSWLLAMLEIFLDGFFDFVKSVIIRVRMRGGKNQN